MSFANVNIGTQPSDGTGDPLRTAFDKINHNFSNIAAGQGFTVNAPVDTVAGRTGNVLLTVSDVAGAASIGYVNGLVLAGNIGSQSYTPANPSHWSPSVTTIVQALDEIAARLTAANI